MKRLILITAIVVYSLFGISAFISVKSENSVNTSNIQVLQREVVNSTYRYTLREQNGVIVVIDNNDGKVIKTTDTLVSLLPIQDQENLIQGINVKDDKELRILLQDFCS